MTPAMAAVFGLVLAGSAQAGRLPSWSLAASPLAEIGRDDGLALQRVVDAAVSADGSVVLADWGASRLLRMSPDGKVVDVLVEPGQLGEFAPSRVFALGDTVLAYDVAESRVATWAPGAEAPEVERTPYDLVVMEAVSSRLWIVARLEPDASSPGLNMRWDVVSVFDADSGRRSFWGRRHTGYRYRLARPGAFATYRTNFLGRTQFVSANGYVVAAPMDGAELEVLSPIGELVKRIALPDEPLPYPPEVGKSTRDQWARNATPEQALRIREMFNRIWQEMPSPAPPVRRLERMGLEVWAQPFSAEDNGKPKWTIVDPRAGAVRATVAVDPEFELLGGSADVAVLLGREKETGGEFVQVRRINRGSVPMTPGVDPDGSATAQTKKGVLPCWSRS